MQALLDKTIKDFRARKVAKTKKANEEELKELESQHVCDAIADILEWVREEIDERFYIEELA